MLREDASRTSNLVHFLDHPAREEIGGEFNCPEFTYNSSHPREDTDQQAQEGVGEDRRIDRMPRSQADST